MIRRSLTLAIGSAVLCSSAVFAVAAPAEAANKTYENCTALHKDYKHGVGRKGAKDKTSGTPVKNFKVSTTIYNKNKKSDRDKDGIACEKR